MYKVWNSELRALIGSKPFSLVMVFIKSVDFLVNLA